MTVKIDYRISRLYLSCWGCSSSRSIEPKSSVQRWAVEELLKQALEDGWFVFQDDYTDEVFSLCPSCYREALARLLKQLYPHPGDRSSPFPSSSDSPSVRGLARALASPLRRVADWLDPQ